jgi:hypothetical protein
MLTAGKWTPGKLRCWIVNCSRGSGSHGKICDARLEPKTGFAICSSEDNRQSRGAVFGQASRHFKCQLCLVVAWRAICAAVGAEALVVAIFALIWRSRTQGGRRRWLTTRRCRANTVTTAGVCRTRGSWQSASERRQLSSCECLPLGLVVVWCERSMTWVKTR